jgi:hypothetical protein
MSRDYNTGMPVSDHNLPPRVSHHMVFPHSLWIYDKLWYDDDNDGAASRRESRLPESQRFYEYFIG